MSMSASTGLTLLLPDAIATRRFGVQLGEILSAGAVLLLEGELGSGKTTLVQGLGMGLGIADPVDSPTFTLINEHVDGRLPLYHLDLYRLEPTAAAELHPEIYWAGQEVELGIVAIEWAERLLFKPDSYLTIQLLYQESGRQARLTPTGFDLNQLDLSQIAERVREHLD